MHEKSAGRMRLDESEHAALTERIKVVADALQLRPDVRRLDGYTQICLRTPDGGSLTPLVRSASRPGSRTPTAR